MQPPYTTSICPSTRTTRPSKPRPTSRRCLSATWSHTSTNINGGLVNGESPLMFLRAPRYLRVCWTALFRTLTSNTLRGTNGTCRHYSLSGVTLDKLHTWSPRIDQVRRRTTQWMVMLCPLLNKKSDFPLGTESCYISSSSGP